MSTSAWFGRTAALVGLLRSWVLCKVAGDDEPDVYSFGIGDPRNAAGTIVAFVGADPRNPIDAHQGQVNGNTGVFTTPRLTTSTSGGLAVWFGAQVRDQLDCPPNPITPPEGFTSLFVEEGCLAPENMDGLLFDAATQPLGGAGEQQDWVGHSSSDETNTSQAVALRLVDESTAPADCGASTPEL